MTVRELLKTITKSNKDSINLIDIRSKEKFDAYHLPIAKHVSKDEIAKNPEKYIDKNKLTYITCNSGNSASRISKELTEKNFLVESLDGGMNDFLESINMSKNSCDI